MSKQHKWHIFWWKPKFVESFENFQKWQHNLRLWKTWNTYGKSHGKSWNFKSSKEYEPWTRWQQNLIVVTFPQKQLISIIEGLCKGHGCLNRTEIITLTAILKSANGFKETASSSEKQTSVSLIQGDDFFQRLQTAFTENGDNTSTSFTKDKSRCSWKVLYCILVVTLVEAVH